MEKLASFENMPFITLGGVEFSKLTKPQRISVLNFICGVAYQYGVLSRAERKKVYLRTEKLLDSLL